MMRLRRKNRCCCGRLCGTARAQSEQIEFDFELVDLQDDFANLGTEKPG
jgi:hypothetical protein